MLGHITFGIFAALALHLVAALPGNLVTIPMPTVLAPDATDTIPLPAAIIGVDNGKTTYRIVDTDTNDPDDTATIAAASNAVSLAISLFDLVGGFDCTITGTDDAAACQGTSLLVSPTEALGELVLDVTATLTGTPASAIGALASGSTTEQLASSTSTKPNGAPRVSGRSSVLMLVGPLLAYHFL